MKKFKINKNISNDCNKNKKIYFKINFKNYK